jgi:four helix bundle protein
MAHFRFESLEIWHDALGIAMDLFDIADELEEKKLWRFADQCRGVGMSIPNNIAESTGSNMLKEQRQLLRYSKRECFEAANILVMLEMRSLITKAKKNELYNRLDIQARRTQSYSDSLKEPRS